MSLNEFAQGIEFLRIKVSFDVVKQVFNYLDENVNGEISFQEFRNLDDENYRKINQEILAEKLENVKTNISKKLLTVNMPESNKNSNRVKQMSFEELEHNIQSTKNPSQSRNSNPYFQISEESSQSEQKSLRQMNKYMQYNSGTKPTQLNPYMYVMSRANKERPDMPKINSKLMKSYDLKDMNHGIPSITSDKIKDVMSNKFLRDSMERRVMQGISINQSKRDLRHSIDNLEGLASPNQD